MRRDHHRLRDAIAIFTRDVATGALTFIDTVNDGVSGLFGVSAIAIAPDGKHLYAVGSVLSALTTFSGDAGSGALTFQDGHEVFASGPADSALAAFGRDPTTGALAFHEAELDGSGTAGLEVVAGIAVSPDGAHGDVAGQGDDAGRGLRGPGAVALSGWRRRGRPR